MCQFWQPFFTGRHLKRPILATLNSDKFLKGKLPLWQMSLKGLICAHETFPASTVLQRASYWHGLKSGWVLHYQDLFHSSPTPLQNSILTSYSCAFNQRPKQSSHHRSTQRVSPFLSRYIRAQWMKNLCQCYLHCTMYICCLFIFPLLTRCYLTFPAYRAILKQRAECYIEIFSSLGMSLFLWFVEPGWNLKPSVLLLSTFPINQR